MLKGDTFITVKIGKENTEINTSIEALYNAIQDKEFLISSGDILVPCTIEKVKVEEAQIYLLSLGQRFLEATPDTMTSTLKGVKLLKDIKNTDLIEIYDESNIDFAGSAKGYSSIHCIECKESAFNGYLYKLKTSHRSFVNLYNGIYVGT